MLDSDHWIEFWTSEKEELKQEQKLLRRLLGGGLAVLFIIGIVLQNPAFLFVSFVSGTLFAIVYFVARKINDHYRNRILKEYPIVKLNSSGYQIGKSFRSWPFASEIISGVVIDERLNYDVLEIRILERRIGYHSIKIPFNKKDKEIIGYYKDFLSTRV